MTDLWGDIEPTTIKTPVSILREQGSLLEKKTNGVLTVKISTNRNNIDNDGTFQHDFIIQVPSLNYQYQLFSISHDITLYPVTFHFEGENILANDEAAFLDGLGNILKSPKTQNILSALLSQGVTA